MKLVSVGLPATNVGFAQAMLERGVCELAHSFFHISCYEMLNKHRNTDCIDRRGPRGLLGDKCRLTNHTYTQGTLILIRVN